MRLQHPNIILILSKSLIAYMAGKFSTFAHTHYRTPALIIQCMWHVLLQFIASISYINIIYASYDLWQLGYIHLHGIAHRCVCLNSEGIYSTCFETNLHALRTSTCTSCVNTQMDHSHGHEYRLNHNIVTFHENVHILKNNICHHLHYNYLLSTSTYWNIS